MHQPIQHIGVFTSGGDSHGMNTALYAIAKAAEVNGIEVSGFRKGYEGLIDNDWRGIKNLGASPPGMHWKIILKIRGKTRGIKPSMRD